jgi:hypothetical protein
MKFVCMKCETYMNFEKVEKPEEESLGVFFGCPSCGARFTMVTNPGETQMVSSLGVQLGGRTSAAQPFEMTRGGLRTEGAGRAEMANYLKEHYGDSPTQASGATESSEPATGQKSGGGCPFSAMVAQMGLGSSVEGKTDAGEHGTPGQNLDQTLEWTPDALDRLEKTPSFIRPMIKGGIEAYARKLGYEKVTLQVMDDSKNSPAGIPWAPAAMKRLDNIPDFIRPMARREIERMAEERGIALITESLMDEAKTKFMNFM